MLTAIRQWVIKTMMKGQTGVVQTLPRKELIELNTQITAERIMRNGINPDDLKTVGQVENVVEQIDTPKVNVNPGVTGVKKADVLDMEGNKIDTSKGIMGGKELPGETNIFSNQYLNDLDKKIIDSDAFGYTQKEWNNLSGSSKEKFRRQFDSNYEDAMKNTEMAPIKTIESDAAIKARIEADNEKGIASMKKKLDDPEEKADGGRIGLKGGTILNFLKNMGKTMNEKSPAQAYKDYLKSVKDRAQKGDMKTLAPEMGIIAAGGILTNRFLKKKLEKMNEAAKAEVEEKADGGRIGLMAGSIPKVLKLLKNKKRVQQAVDDIFPTGDYKYDAQMAADALVENNPKTFGGKLYEDLDMDTQMEVYGAVIRPITNKMATQMQLQRATRPEKTLASMNEGKGIDMSDPEIADEFGRFMKETDPKGYKELEQKVELSNFKTKDRKGNADGGIMRSAYAGGGMGRRGFLKLLGSLGAGAAAIKTGILGLGGKGAGKQVAKEVVQSAGSGTPPPYFFKLAEKIKKFGDDVTPKYSTQERQVVKQYKDYELTEDMGTGKIEISKKNFPEGDEAVDYFGEPLMEDVYMSYKPGEMVEGAGGKVLKSADEYIEDTAYVRSSGPQTGNISSEMDGIAEETFKKIIKDIDEAPSIKIKKASGGIARMLGE